MSDDVIWQVISNGFCSFKVKTDTGELCRNENNVTGLCNKISCPLANSRYATVREIDGECFLFVKVIERAHLPANMYEKIRLKGSQEHVFARIAKELQYMPEFYRAKCEARYVRYQEYLRRIERIKNDPTQPILTAKNKKVLRREASREARSKKVAQIENAIERELLDRLQKGVYGDIYNLPQKTFETILDNYGEQEEINEDEFIEDSEADSEYESDEEIDDLEESDIEFEDYMGVITKEKRQPIVNVEYEIEEPMEK